MSDLPRTHTPATGAAARAGTGRSESLTGTVEVDFPEFRTPPAEPIGLITSWLRDSDARGVREPRALALATVDTLGRPSSRIVTVAEVTATGLVFLTHADSRKGRELAARPWASGVLYWRETSRQITVAGPVHRLPDAEADARWFARPVFTHAMSTVSRQSRALDGLNHVGRLRAGARALGEPQRPLPRPESFAAYQLTPDCVEFWANGTDRLHERLRYERAGHGWQAGRLQP